VHALFCSLPFRYKYQCIVLIDCLGRFVLEMNCYVSSGTLNLTKLKLKSHTGFRLVPTSMTLNGIIVLILRFSPNLIALLAKYVTIVEYRPIMFVNIASQFQSSTSGHNYLTLQRGLSAIAELLVLDFVFVISDWNLQFSCQSFSRVK